jgi:hypothetical protein
MIEPYKRFLGLVRRKNALLFFGFKTRYLRDRMLFWNQVLHPCLRASMYPWSIKQWVNQSSLLPELSPLAVVSSIQTTSTGIVEDYNPWTWIKSGLQCLIFLLQEPGLELRTSWLIPCRIACTNQFAQKLMLMEKGNTLILKQLWDLSWYWQSYFILLLIFVFYVMHTYLFYLAALLLYRCELSTQVWRCISKFPLPAQGSISNMFIREVSKFFTKAVGPTLVPYPQTQCITFSWLTLGVWTCCATCIGPYNYIT